MGVPKPHFIANQLIEHGNNNEFRKLQDVLFDIIKNKMPTFSDEEILDYVEQYKDTIATELFLKENEKSTDGIDLNFDISEEDDGHYIRFFDKPEIKLLRSIQTNTSKNFEHFCARILEKLGGKALVEGGTDDQGIDFTAFDLRIQNLSKISTKGSRIYVFGQAKRYKDGNHVVEKELREFVGCCIKRIDDFKRTRSDQYGVLQPTILAFWTTSDFHINAKNFAKDMGIWYLNGIALCQLAIELGVE
jgi:restriction endonuclease Mrr